MSIVLFGKKLGMSRIFNNKGNFLPVTLINIPFNFVFKKFFYNFFKYLKISYIFKKKLKFNFNINKYWNFKKNFYISEIKVSEFEFFFLNLNEVISLNSFYINQRVDVTSYSIGKGFSGVIKKHNFKSGTASHGNSKSHRVGGSTGMNQDPGRVFSGKKMPGQLGNKKTTIQNLKILKIDFEFNVLYVKGNVPGYDGCGVFIKSSKKKKIY